jgi:hypothetical protein
VSGAGIHRSKTRAIAGIITLSPTEWGLFVDIAEYAT